MGITPCKDCGERRSGCHSECAAYILYREGCDKRMEERHTYYVTRDYAADQRIKNAKRAGWQKRK